MAASVTASVGFGDKTASTTLETGTLTPTGANKTLYFLVGSADDPPVNPTAVKYASASGVGGESLTLLDSVRTFSTFNKTSVWKLVAPVAASGTIHVTWGSSQTERWGIGVAVQDADGTEGAITFVNQTDVTAISADAASVSGDLVMGFLTVFDLNPANPQLTATQTSVYELESSTPGANGISDNQSAAIWRATASGATTTISGTIGVACDYGMHVFAVNGAATGISLALSGSAVTTPQREPTPGIAITL
jgi:hypothetical protein